MEDVEQIIVCVIVANMQFCTKHFQVYCSTTLNAIKKYDIEHNMSHINANVLKEKVTWRFKSFKVHDRV